MGVSEVLREAGRATTIVALEPAGSPFLTTGVSGAHHVEGTGIGFMPPPFERTAVDDIRASNEAQGREMARRLAREEGLFCGINSGCNVVGALQLARELGPVSAVSVAYDPGLKYLAGALFL